MAIITATITAIVTDTAKETLPALVETALQRYITDTRVVKKLNRTVLVVFTGQPSPAPCLAIHCALAHTHHL
jgi:hypothetical protein